MANQTAMTMQQAAAGQSAQLLSKYGYAYSGEIVALASGANGTTNVIVQADSAFLYQALCCFAYNTVTNAEVASPIAKVQITDTGSGTQLFDNPQFIRNVAGTSQLPFLLPTPRVLQPSATLLITVNNINSANAVTFQFTFHGQKLYK